MYANAVSIAAVLAALPLSSAFAPAALAAPRAAALRAASLNGWQPDESQFAYGLPGSLDPAPEFDPFGFAERADLAQMKSYREAETTHGRVAMLAVIGFLVTEAPFEFHPLFETGAKDIGPAIRHLDEVREAAPFFFEVLAVVIGAAELKRALTGWESPGAETGRALKEDYFPGDIGFDPLGLKPDDPTEFLEMSTKELQHGRLAMLAIAGWPMAEFASGNSLRELTNGRAPSLFNGHLLDYTPFLAVVFGGMAAFEFITKDKPIKEGDYNFDPLGFASGIGADRTLKLAEVKHGRAAMMGITGFAVQEFFWGTPVVQQTPFFFLPFGGFTG